MVKRQNIKVIENKETKVSCSGDEKSGKHPLIYLTIDEGRAECYYCGRLFVAKDVHEKYLKKTRKDFKNNKTNVQRKTNY